MLGEWWAHDGFWLFYGLFIKSFLKPSKAVKYEIDSRMWLTDYRFGLIVTTLVPSNEAVLVLLPIKPQRNRFWLIYLQGSSGLRVHLIQQLLYYWIQKCRSYLKRILLVVVIKVCMGQWRIVTNFSPIHLACNIRHSKTVEKDWMDVSLAECWKTEK